MNDDGDIIKPNFKSVYATMKIGNTSDSMISYFELLSKMMKNEIDSKDLRIRDMNNIVWTFDNEGNFIKVDNFGTEFLCEHYSDVEFPSLMVEILGDDQETINKKEASKKVLLKLENLYMDLSMTIDNCQGCMDDLDLAFAELNVYSDLIEYLGGNVKDNYSRMVDDWYEKQRKLDEKEKERKNPTFPTTKTSMLDFLNDEDKVSDAIVDLILTVNEISHKLNNKQEI